MASSAAGGRSWMAKMGLMYSASSKISKSSHLQGILRRLCCSSPPFKFDAERLPRHSYLQRPISQPTAFTHPHLMSVEEITPGISREEYRMRRRVFGERLPHRSVAIIPSSAQQYMSQDVPYLYHPSTDLYYLTGLTEPGAVLVVEKGFEGEGLWRERLFLEQRNPAHEVWGGPRCGVEDDVRDYFAVEHIHNVSELGQVIKPSLRRARLILYDFKLRPDISAQILSVGSELDPGLLAKMAKLTPSLLLQQQRITKSEAEAALMRTAGEIVARSLNEAMMDTTCRKGTNRISERYIEARIEHNCKVNGADRMAFPCVVASGNNGIILHYMANNSDARLGDMVMVDAGCQYHGYCSDVSRSWPVSGKFSAGQREIYSLVLDVQKRAIEMISPKNKYEGQPMSMDRIHSFTVKQLTQGLLDLKVITGLSVEGAIESNAFFKFYPHAAGHYLGLDVHDTNNITKDAPLRPGMIVTVEPGLYIPSGDHTVPEIFRGIGIRIEDDILVRESGTENLSSAAVKEVDDIERLVGSK